MVEEKERVEYEVRASSTLMSGPPHEKNTAISGVCVRKSSKKVCDFVLLTTRQIGIWLTFFGNPFL